MTDIHNEETNLEEENVDDVAVNVDDSVLDELVDETSPIEVEDSLEGFGTLEEEDDENTEEEDELEEKLDPEEDVDETDFDTFDDIDDI